MYMVKLKLKSQIQLIKSEPYPPFLLLRTLPISRGILQPKSYDVTSCCIYHGYRRGKDGELNSQLCHFLLYLLVYLKKKKILIDV